MEEYRIFEPEVATNLFDELQGCRTMIPDYRKAYLRLNRVFMKCLDQKTDIVGVRFNGPFAKTDYLLKEYQAPKLLRAMVNDTRVRLRKMDSRSEKDLADHFMYDWKAVCQFVALVYQMPVPSLLEIHFPATQERERKEIATECLRVIVNRWDDTYLYAEADEEGTDEVKVYYGGASPKAVYKEWDWSYLRDILKRNCQLNLVRPREENGVLYPELIVFEPDYLVDISAVAACFEQYSHSHLNHLLNKIKPAPLNSATLLGNLASQLLDDALQPEEIEYSSSVITFFKSNAISLATTKLDKNFHVDGRAQRLNIHILLKSILPTFLRSEKIKFDSSDIMVEPSFFSEMLGLQGRMDFLELDQKIVIEQKSGKGGYPPKAPETPVAQEKHYVQLLLYWLLLRYNNHEQYKKNQGNLQTFLLYSKYREGLLRMSYAPELVFKAMRTRNEIAANEYSYTRGKIRILGQLTADNLNMENVKGRLWEDYQRPQINEVLAPIHSASPLEQAYYYRFLTFLETEHLMSKVGNQTKENSGFADKWHSTLEVKLQAGNIYCDMELITPTADCHEKVETVRLKFMERPDNDISNFRTGDIVILYPYDEGTEPDARQTMVFRSTIREIGEETILLSLRAAQVNGNVFWHKGRKRWAIEHDFFESSYSPLYRGMHAFLSAPKERRDLLLLQRAPSCDQSLTLNGDYGTFNHLSLKVKQAQDLFLIIGPPGTGKTSYGLMNTLKEELLTEGTNILLLSYTNRAVDEICSKLVEEHLDFIRIGGTYSCEECYRPYLLDTVAQRCGNVNAMMEVIARTRIFTGTTSSIGSKINLFKIKQFSLAIIDEASQILEPHLIGLLSARDSDGKSAIRKIVLIGDHKQLPAVVQQKEEESEVHDQLLNNIHLTNCRLSLFERLLKQYRSNPDVVYMLTKQGRMHQDIAQFPNYTFYQNKLQVVPLPHQDKDLRRKGQGKNGIDDLLSTRRIAFVAVPPPEDSPSDKVNTNEAQAIAATVVRIYELNKDHFSQTDTVGVIVPYRNQIAEVRKNIEKSGIAGLRDITIDTVERFQGSQRDYILYGFTIQQYHQLNFLTSNVFEEDNSIIDRKLNVAMTRAREHLLLFGNEQLLANNITFYKLIEFVRSKHGYLRVNLADYVQGHFTVTEWEKDLNLGQATYPTGTSFEAAFHQLVTTPINSDPRTRLPEVILGRDTKENLEVIGYGRTNFSRQPSSDDSSIQLPRKEQILLYCHYLMRLFYCSSKALFCSHSEWLRSLIKSTDGRVQFIDIGCGPATCGLAFAEYFLIHAPTMRYTGIDVSAEMRETGEDFLQAMFDNRLQRKMLTSMAELGDGFWEVISEVPQLVVFNLSYVFSNIQSVLAEQWAVSMGNLMRKYPLNRYVFFIQHTESDRQLNAYKVFRTLIDPVVDTYRDEQAATHYTLDGQKHDRTFCYEILTDKQHEAK